LPSHTPLSVFPAQSEILLFIGGFSTATTNSEENMSSEDEDASTLV